MELYEYLKAAEEEQRKRLEGADTAAGVIAALGGSGETAFWNGGGDGIDFLFALPPGWDQEWSEASYHWIAKNQQDELIEYCEGDVCITDEEWLARMIARDR